MSQTSILGNERVSFRITAEDKSLLVRAAALQQANLTEFVIRPALSNAARIIDKSEKLKLTGRDSLKVLDLLENPPPPNKQLMTAARAMPKSR